MAAKCFFGISHSEVFLKLENAEMSHFPFKYKNIDFMLIYWMNSKKNVWYENQSSLFHDIIPFLYFYPFN